MRMEAKVYMSHTDLARIQEAAKRSSMTVSGYMRHMALLGADVKNVPEYRSVLDGQGVLPGISELPRPELAKVGGE